MILLTHLSHPRKRKEAARTEKPSDVENQSKTVSSRHDRMTALELIAAVAA